MPGADEGVLVFVGSGSRYYREYFFRDAREAGYRIVLVKDGPVDWESQYVEGVIQADISRGAAVLDALEASPFAPRVRGVLTCCEEHVAVTAEVSTGMGVPGLPPEVALRARNKHLMRRRLSERGVPCPRFRLTQSPNEAEEFAREVGFPVVMKPVGGMASFGVIRVDTPEQLQWQFLVTASIGSTKYRSPEVLVEEYMAGPEVSVESVSCRGKTRVVAVTAKTTGPEPYFEEVGHQVPAPYPPELVDRIASVASSAVEALGVADGISHAELRLTAEGPKVVEVGARLAGDFIPRLVRLALGVDMVAAAAAVACGGEPGLDRRLHRSACVHFFMPEMEGVIAAVEGEDEARRCPGVEEIRLTAVEGRVVGLPPRQFFTRLGHVIVTGADAREAGENLDRVLRIVRLRVREGGN